MGCTNTKVHPVNFDPVPQAKETWFERKVKRRSGKVKQNLLSCFTRDSNLKTRKIAWPEQPRSVKTTQNIEDAFSVKTTQSNEDAVSVKTTKSEEDALSVKCTLSNEDAVSVKTTQSKEDALSVKCTLSNEDEVSVKTTQSNEDALSGDSSFSDDVSDVSTLTTESESSSFSDNVSDVSTLATESESSRCSDDVSDVSTLTTESESSSFSDDVSDVSTLTTESDTESSSSSGSFESVIDLPVSPPKPSRGQTTPVSKTREEILLKNIARAGFQIDPVPRNGDCFFGAAARQLGRGDPRIDTTALQLRKDLVHHIRAHSEKFCVAISEDTPARRRNVSEKLRDAIADNPSSVKAVVEYHTSFPSLEEHQNHPIVGEAAQLREEVDETIVEKIKSLTRLGVKKISEMRRHLVAFVTDVLFKGRHPPPPTRRRYTPTNRDIWNRMASVKDATKDAKQDQRNVQTEKSEDIREALQVFREWNPDWQPSHFMVDFCEAEIGALEEEFPDSEVLLCDFHREKAWVEWVRKRDHGVFDDQRTVLCLLRNIAAATTHDEYNMRVDQLKASNIWQQSAQLRTWFSTKWLTNAERWVHVFRDENLKISIYTNNGVERQNETLKYSHLEGRTRISLSEMITVVVTDFLPTSYRRYIQLNVMYSSCYRRYNSKLPRFLHDRPRGVVTHIMSRMEEAAVCFNPDDIGQVGNGVFHVKSTTDPSKSHIVNFGTSASNMPFCTCKDWSRNKLPCKHFCAVFTLLKEWGWEKLASAYKDNPILSLDHTCLGQTAVSNERDDSSSDTDGISTSSPPSPPSPPPPSESSYLGLPEPKRSKKKLLQMECASLLREITNLTYNVEEEYLRSFKQQLVNLMEDMQQNAPRDDSVPQLPIDASQLPKKRKRETPVDNVSDLPTRPSKHPSSRRVGHRAEMMRETLRVNVSMDTIVEENEELETYIESDLEAVVDCDMENDEAQNEWLVINDTKLTQKDRQILQEELWLNDKHINSAQKLISNEYPLIDGLGDTVILTANQQGPVPASSDCVQMHNVKDHWVVSTSVGGNITVYDSLQPSMKPELRSQLANLYRQLLLGKTVSFLSMLSVLRGNKVEMTVDCLPLPTL
uniref:SWIM-type domain-containing protein n=1 Tax=Branchiostoma floridae TaxID=7739 RepID=C3XUQ8_BRAFL|eukprot:XP_002612248.1 hypothetical protein BRAFLDRAFT_100078 [Branchiostoma floridae]